MYFAVMPRIKAIYRQPEGEVKVGERVTITCEVDNTDSTPSIKFIHRMGSELVTRHESETPTYTIKAVSIEDSGEWFCEALNSVGDHRSSKIQLIVKHRPLVINYGSPMQFNATLDSNARMQCNFKAYPALRSATWYQKTTVYYNSIDPPSSRWTELEPNVPGSRLRSDVMRRGSGSESVTAVVLHIRGVTKADLGSYKATVDNGMGKGDCELTLAERTFGSTNEDKLTQSAITLSNNTILISLLCLLSITLLINNFDLDLSTK
ncbi:roundabout homolog 1-like isoform X2 [Convolutriloba macropyga]|uniref:roundabout homolog 1-like isoform X2 n=1 Tax=Convolutriloba macropyga TaxID=536237 RepID=UPI003F525CCB